VFSVLLKFSYYAWDFFQTHQEKMYQDYVANKAKEKTTQLEQYYNQVLSKMQTELNCILILYSNYFIYGTVVNFSCWTAQAISCCSYKISPSS